jgi:hypothetical protein
LLAASLLAASSYPALAKAAPPAGGVGDVVPFLGVVVGWGHRNRIYSDANAFISDRNRYYDSLRDTARRQLIDREIGGLHDSQVAAYVKLVALIERNRRAETDVAEARKREARAAFHRRLEGVLLQRVLGTEALQRLLGAMANGANRGQGLIDAALNKLSGGGGGFLSELERVRRIARDVEAVSGAVGGPTGNGLRRAAGRIAATIERPQQLIKADLERVRDELGQLSELTETLARTGRTPSAAALAQGLILRPPGGSDDPAVEAISALLSRLAVANGSLRDQARAAVRAGFVARCAAISSEFRQALARLAEGGEADGDVVSSIAACTPAELDSGAVAKETTTAEAAPGPLPEGRCALAGTGDFVIENIVVSSSGGACDESVYPFGLSSEPLLAYMAVAGRWVPVSDVSWTWQATEDLQGAIVEATALLVSDSLEISVAVTVPPSGSSFFPMPGDRASHPAGEGNGLALAVLAPLFPLAVRFSPRKRRRLILTTLAILAFLLMAQSCEVYGTFSGRYTFPLPQDGFACEVAPDNPNLAEMPGARGQSSFEITVADEDGPDTCSVSGSASGLGVLKRDGIYTQDMIE